jgi:hypothetical protein
MDLDKKTIQEIQRSQEIMYGKLLTEAVPIRNVVSTAIANILKTEIDDVIKAAIRTMKTAGTKVDDFAKVQKSSIEELLKRVQKKIRGNLTSSERAGIFQQLRKNRRFTKKLKNAQKTAVGTGKNELMVLPNTTKYEVASLSTAAKSEITPFVKNEIAVLNKTGISRIGDFKSFLTAFEQKGIINTTSSGARTISKKNLWALAILLGVGFLTVKDEAKKNGVVLEGSSDNNVKGGGSEYKQKNVQTFYPIVKDIPVFSTPKDTVWKKSKNGAFAKKELKTGFTRLGFSCENYKDYDFIYAKKWFKNKLLGSVLKKQFCSGKTNDPEVPEVPEVPDPNTPLVSGISGNRYTFDFGTVMKAIDDTGKCPRSGSSSLSGTSGTSGTQGTSGTAGIETPLPVSNKLSSELYYKMIGS